MAGRFPAEIENPAPVIEADLTVIGAVPDEVRVRDFVTAVPTETFPKSSEDALRTRADVDGLS